MNWLKSLLIGMLRVTIGMLSGMTVFWLTTTHDLGAAISDTPGLFGHIWSMLTGMPLLWGGIWILLVGASMLRDYTHRPKTRGPLRPGMVD